MKKTALTFLTALIVLSGGSMARAQDVVQDLVTPEKRALIKELVDITKSRESFNEIMTNTIAFERDQVQQMSADMINGDKRLTPAARTQANKFVNDMVQNILTKSEEFFHKEFDFDQFVEHVFVPIYDKHFTEGELRDMIAFYRTPTGQKTIKEMPSLMLDTMVAVSKDLLPKYREFIKQTVDEEMAALRQKIAKQRTARGT